MLNRSTFADSREAEAPMRTVRPPFTVFVLFVVLASNHAPQATAVEPDEPWRLKVHPSLLDSDPQAEVECIVVLARQAEVRQADAVRDRGERVVHRLRERAAVTQAPILEQLASLGAAARPFWVANLIWVRGDREVVESLARRFDVARIDANPVLPRARPQDGTPNRASSIAAVEWNINHVGADEVWTMGYDGSGVVIGSQDTGFFWQHPALKGQYRGWDGAAADHAYNWHDAIHVNTLAPPTCPADSPQPCDDGFFFPHGTYTMGIAAGDDGATNQIGVSPGARWIGCRNSDLGGGTPASYIECFQWLIAPTDLNDENPDPTKAPHVINNSWACIPAEGCNPDTLQLVVDNVRAAGIVVVAAAGNDGAECETIDYPPAIYESALTVGGTDAYDVVSPTSSRGPVTIDGSGRMKPNLVAPGLNVRSAVGILDIYTGNVTYDYLAATGTSAAAPHVAGAVALLLDARPDLIGHVEEIESLLEASALPLTASQPCGGVPSGETPNHVYGHGRLDLVALIAGDADADGSSNLDDCAPVDDQAWSVPRDVLDLRMTGGVESVLSWSAPVDPGAANIVYDLLRSSGPNDFSSAECLAADITETSASDAAVPPAGFYYLVRTENGCGTNTGAASDGTPRSAPMCDAGL